MTRRRFGALVAVALAVLLVAGGGAYLLSKTLDDADGDGAALPAGWSLCTNHRRGFAIGYPSGWDVAHERYKARGGACAFFDPKPLRIPRIGVFDGSALEVHVEDLTPKPWVKYMLDVELSGFVHCPAAPHSVEKVTVNGIRTFRLQGHSCGTRVYAYAVRHNKGAVVVMTTREGASATKLVDVAVHTLQFFKPPARKGPGCLVPSVVGLPLAAGKARIRESHCSVGRVLGVRSARNIGRIAAQLPHPGRRGAPGTGVDVAVGRR